MASGLLYGNQMLLPTFTMGSKYLLPAKKIISNTGIFSLIALIKTKECGSNITSCSYVKPLVLHRCATENYSYKGVILNYMGNKS